MPEPIQTVPPYAALAAGYDVVMEHVDYETWAEYVHGLIQRHLPGARALLELGCGTGSTALALQLLGDYRYTGTDLSPAMIRVARAKADLEGLPIQFEVADFTAFRTSAPVDVALLLYDGLNYLLEEDQVLALLRHVYAAVRPGGLFVFDQSTPANSENNEAYFEDEGQAEAFAYVRRSHYDRATHLHTTTFELTVEGQAYYEEHVQRAYPLAVLRALVRQAGFRELAAYDGFSHTPADALSERVHWVVQRPEEAAAAQ